MPPSARPWISAAAVLAAATAGYAWRGRSIPLNPPPDTTPSPPRIDLNRIPVASALNDELASVVQAVLPGVVSIHVERSIPVTERTLRPGQPPVSESAESREPGVGSGAIVTPEGHIITNWHVIEGGLDSLKVTLHG